MNSIIIIETEFSAKGQKSASLALQKWFVTSSPVVVVHLNTLVFFLIFYKKRSVFSADTSSGAGLVIPRTREYP